MGAWILTSRPPLGLQMRLLARPTQPDNISHLSFPPTQATALSPQRKEITYQPITILTTLSPPSPSASPSPPSAAPNAAPRYPSGLSPSTLPTNRPTFSTNPSSAPNAVNTSVQGASSAAVAAAPGDESDGDGPSSSKRSVSGGGAGRERRYACAASREVHSTSPEPKRYLCQLASFATDPM